MLHSVRDSPMDAAATFGRCVSDRSSQNPSRLADRLHRDLRLGWFYTNLNMRFAKKNNAMSAHVLIKEIKMAVTRGSNLFYVPAASAGRRAEPAVIHANI